MAGISGSCRRNWRMGIEGSSEKLTRGPRLNFLMELTDLPLNGSESIFKTDW
jgi:hypothetical protein